MKKFEIFWTKFFYKNGKIVAIIVKFFQIVENCRVARDRDLGRFSRPRLAEIEGAEIETEIRTSRHSRDQDGEISIKISRSRKKLEISALNPRLWQNHQILGKNFLKISFFNQNLFEKFLKFVQPTYFKNINIL